ncbi:2'-5' RNA ligase [Paenibacillus sp. FSL H8-0548]|uniref:RNA 2',3'-cyclic phosphodiesterase n=1 Tax=Paenibacillus sp. FSL H8-0548 TaxID=1920422 RepID=UPI00096E515F|nr:RNA 2',3'-cyclic phosphodiesterase [Paenibacillus sp. FSL H8-0548]OMF37041.1 2'-5' RNA ligase [Paenibacillus sp. FSL H8-0548]
MSSETLRLFIAIPIDEKWREQLIEKSTLLKSNLHFQKWTHPEDYHITLKFLGDTSVSKIQQIEKLLNNVAEVTDPFELRGKGWGTFGSQTSPNILWASVGGDLNSLTELHRKIDDSMDGLFPRENRVFSPHLTIARRYKGKDQLKTSIEDYFPDAIESVISWSVKEMKLYESNLQKKPMYKSIASFKFV